MKGLQAMERRFENSFIDFARHSATNKCLSNKFLYSNPLMDINDKYFFDDCVKIFEWGERNFDRDDIEHSMQRNIMGTTEEIGEYIDALLMIQSLLSKSVHAFLKQDQGIRKTYDELEDMIKDALADICIFSMNGMGCLIKNDPEYFKLEVIQKATNYSKNLLGHSSYSDEVERCCVKIFDSYLIERCCAKIFDSYLSCLRHSRIIGEGSPIFTVRKESERDWKVINIYTTAINPLVIFDDSVMNINDVRARRGRIFIYFNHCINLACVLAYNRDIDLYSTVQATMTKVLARDWRARPSGPPVEPESV